LKNNKKPTNKPKLISNFWNLGYSNILKNQSSCLIKGIKEKRINVYPKTRLTIFINNIVQIKNPARVAGFLFV